MLGHVVVRAFAQDSQVHASVRDPAAALHLGIPARLHPFDASDHPAQLLERIKPHVVINCIGLVKQRREASEPLPAITVNALFPHTLAAACGERGIRLIHVSTDCVFSGQLEPPHRYSEAMLPDPVDLYGRSKLLGEVNQAAVTLRTSMIGRELDRASGLLEWLLTQRGSEIKGFSNAVFSGPTALALAQVLHDVAHMHPSIRGLYHVAAEPISKLDLLDRLNQALDLRCVITPVDEPRINRALDGSAFEAETGIRIPPWDELIEGIQEETRVPRPK